ncbi:Hcp family type VI secretion system effector [Chitinimonas lacunae]|uniref:Hcp family type VI secretion system effector n=1 Tax=Chitinimonas lacunae TaxID=1963018 RepID=A0ABV8MVD0_9NEIS
MAQPNGNMFLKIEGVNGESQVDQHKGEIDVQSFSWGMTQGTSIHVGQGGGHGRVSIHDLSFTHYVDKSSPILMLKCMNGSHFPKATLTVRKSGGDSLAFYKIIMDKVFVTSVSTGGSNSQGDGLMETVTLTFAQVDIEYTPQSNEGGGTGVVNAGWDIQANKAK